MFIAKFNSNHFDATVESTAAAFGLQFGFVPNKGDYSSTKCLVGGKTFPVKDQLKAAGARWNAPAKAWEFATEEALAAAILSLVQ